ncbi:MAG: hypothetical protein WBW51_01375, partial [Methyloceanibacter sp.]
MMARSSNPDKRSPKNGLDRRSILLSGASLVALSALGAHKAEAQSPGAPTAQPQASGSKPNILVIYG